MNKPYEPVETKKYRLYFHLAFCICCAMFVCFIVLYIHCSNLEERIAYWQKVAMTEEFKR